MAKPKSTRIYRTAFDWTAKQAIRTPQFYVLLAAYFGHLFVGITIASFSVAHLTERGVSLKLAGVMLGVESLVGTAGRALGGVLGDLIDPRWLLLLALLVLTIGSLSLSVARSDLTLIIYAIGSGFGFGVTALAVALLLLNYYGRTHNLEIFSLTCLIGAVSALGPVIGGMLRDAERRISVNISALRCGDRCDLPCSDLHAAAAQIRIDRNADPGAAAAVGR